MKNLLRMLVRIICILVVIVNQQIELSQSTLSEEQIIKDSFFINNIYFEEVAFYLMSFQHNINCYYMDNKLIIKEIDSDYEERIISIENQEVVQSIQHILTSLGYEDITKYEDVVYFHYNTTGPLPYETGIVYSKEDVIKDPGTFSPESKLKDHWYCFFFGYT